MISRRHLLASGLLTSAATITACNKPQKGMHQWYHAYNEPGVRQAVKKYAQRYSASHFPVTVEWIAGDYDRKVGVALLSNQGPDIVELPGNIGIDRVRSHEIHQLDTVYAAHDYAADLIPALKPQVYYEGHYYGVPQCADAQLIFYRPSVLAKKGIAPPTTFAELMNAALELSTPDMQGLFLGNSLGSQLASTIIASCGIEIITENSTAGTLTTPALADTLSQLHTLYTQGALLAGCPMDWSAPMALTTGLCAMQVTGTWAIPTLEHLLGDDLAAIPWPAYSSHCGNPDVPLGSYNTVISHVSRYKSQAEEYIAWLWMGDKETAPDTVLDFSLSYGLHLPARLSLLKDAAPWHSSALRTHTLETVLSYGHLTAHPCQTPIMTTAIMDAYSRCVREGQDPMSELRHTQERIAQELLRLFP